MAYNPGYVDGKLVASNAAYVPGVGLWKAYDSIAGTPAYWIYVTTDSLGAVQVSGYISDATFKRVKVGDIVDVFSGTLLSETVTPPVGNTLGAATFAATLGVLSQFNGVPQYMRCIVSTVTAGTQSISGVGTLTPAEPPIVNFSNNPRNVVDGGDFTTNPWQGGTSFTNITTSTVLTADRWNAIGGTGAVSGVSRQAHTDVAGFTQALRWGRSSTDTHTTGLTLGHVIETSDSARLQGLPVSLSFWAQAGTSFAVGASAGVFSAIVVASTGTDDTFANLCAGSWTSASNVVSAAVTPTTTSVRYGPFSGTVPTGATQLGVVFTYTPSAGTTAGTTETIDFQGIQLETGGMTPFEHLDVAEVVSICQRYRVVFTEGTTGTQTGGGLSSATTTTLLNVALPTTMRKAPTVTITTGGFAVTNGAGTAVGITGIGSAATLHTTQNIGLLATVASGLTAGQATLLVGRTTGSGSIVCNADY